jgi:predicted MFS family arabinose efflux permease
MAVGALLGALLTAAAGERDGPPERRIVRALLVAGLALAAAGWAPSLAGLGAALVVVGIADGTLLPAILLVRSAYSRPDERGAVFTTAASIKVGAGAAGAALGGALIGAAGAATALVVAAVLQVAGALLCLGYRDAS